MKSNEIWKPIKDFEGLYEVSNLGRVKSFDRVVNCGHGKTRVMKGKILKEVKLRDGYFYVRLCKDTISTRKSIHRLVAETYIPNLDNKKEVNHIDGNKRNNNVSNLEWVTPKENMRHAWETGLLKPHSTKKKVSRYVKDNVL